MISIDFHYETFLLLFLVSALVICIVLKLKKRKFYDFIFNLSVLLYVLLLIKVVFLPIRIVSDQTNFAIWEENTGNSLQLVPFKTIIRSFSIGEWKMQVLGNILLLLPVPIFMKLQNTKNTYSNKKLFLVGLALSFAIEVIQFCINILTGVTEKISDIDDSFVEFMRSISWYHSCKICYKIKKNIDEKGECKMRLKRTMSVLFFCTIFMLTSITVFAATKSRSSTYSIYHGVYSTNMSMKDKVIVKLTPSQCSKSNLGLYLEKKYFWGWRSPGVGTNSKDVSSKYNSTTTLGGGVPSGTYRVYIRNWDGVNQAKGKVVFTWTKS